MDEQTTQQVTQTTNPEPEQQPEAQPDITLDHEGNLNFSDEFLDYDKTEYQHDEQPVEEPQEKAPSLYSDEELNSIPYEQWDKARMPKEAVAYYEAAAKQWQARANQERIQEQMRQAPLPDFLQTPPKQFTPKELAAEARKLAMQKLGLKDGDDFSPDYDEEHRAAVDMARQEIMQSKQLEVIRYNQFLAEYQELNNFNARFSQMPDFPAFNQWYINTLTKIGKTDAEVKNALHEMAKTYGPAEVQKQLASWYQRFKNETAQQPVQQPSMPQSKTRKARARPAVLESTRGGDSRPSNAGYDARDFGRMTQEQQIQALMDMGLCNIPRGQR